MSKYRVTVPPTAELGSYTTIARASGSETYQQNALWDYNKCREREGHEPLTRMPAGTKYERIE